MVLTDSCLLSRSFYLYNRLLRGCKEFPCSIRETFLKFKGVSLTHWKASKGENPQIGETSKIKAKNVPRFIPGKILKNAVK
ncbi:MAG: HU family DNA-binding protein [Desulfobacteraceae bacterium]|nr:MAG: HU family DNA-binding protein [Desulfobacteraceae bacterium]